MRVGGVFVVAGEHARWQEDCCIFFPTVRFCVSTLCVLWRCWCAAANQQQLPVHPPPARQKVGTGFRYEDFGWCGGVSIRKGGSLICYLFSFLGMAQVRTAWGSSVSKGLVIPTASEYYSKIRASLNWTTFKSDHSGRVPSGIKYSQSVLTLRVQTDLQQDPKLRYCTISTSCQQSRSKIIQINLLRDSSLQHDDYLPTGTTFYVWCDFDRHLPRQSS
jgi:hypothetical protein